MRGFGERGEICEDWWRSKQARMNEGGGGDMRGDTVEQNRMNL